MTRSPGHQHEEATKFSRPEDGNPGAHDNPQISQKGPRKRTKTGCLTCRKRRIKCGEEKPTCSNCTKSKRFCEGYHHHPRMGPRLPSSALGQADDAFNASRPFLPNYASFESHPSGFRRLDTGVPLQNWRPIAPTPLQVHQQNDLAARGSSYLFSGSAFTPTLGSDGSLVDPSPVPLSADFSRTFQSGSRLFSADGETSLPYGPTQRHASISGPNPEYRHWVGALTAEDLQNRPWITRSNALTSSNPAPGGSTSQLCGEVSPHMVLPNYASGSQISSSIEDSTPFTSTQIAAFSGQPLSPDHPFYPDMKAQIYGSGPEASSKEHDPRKYSGQGFVQRPSFNLTIPTAIESPPSVTASQAICEDDDDDDDDPWDVEMQCDEINVEPSEQSKQDLQHMLIMHASHQERRGTRSYTTFLNHKNILASYRPSHAALPLADEKAARIFCHFVSSTGPSLTIYERSSTQQIPNAGLATISGFQQPLWTYTLPTLALNHPPLMHAMLALSALHISKLQQTSPGPSIKHFTYALRRVGRLIGLPKRRNEVTTLAANLLLGFYEVMSAETSKWNIHLTGARVLAMEIDFAGKTRKIRALRAQAKSQLAQLGPESHAEYIACSGIPQSLLPDRDWDVDEDLISTFTGYNVQYDYQYQTNISPGTYENMEFTAKDVELYKMQSDLYWWYCKQDIFQSMISGNRLLMRYDHWVFCPPRGQLGQLDLIYATMDHLCLILARLADFGGKDQVRKRRVMAAKSSQASQSSAQTNSIPKPPPNGQAPPMGYMPEPTSSIPMHSAFATMSANIHDSAFSQPTYSPNPPPTPSAQDLESETTAALVEHAAISRAIDIFEHSLPPEYDPLPPDAAPPISTPFGPALQYRTHTISCIWAFFYSGRILLHRLHPHMPPAAMISAQAAAPQTATYAQRIGKICAGLYYPQQYNLQTGSLNPSLGGALIESTFALFFAAIQFQDHAQRGWTINKLKEIARLSGWQTAAAVAAGCEFAWEATGKAGRGPRYTPTMDWRNKDDRVGDKGMKKQGLEREREMQAAQRQQSGKERDGNGRKENESGEEEGEKKQEERLRTEGEEEFFVAAGKDAPLRRSSGRSTKFYPGMDKGRARQAEDDEEAEPEAITHDRKTIGTNPYARAHWALGLLSLNEDIAKIDLGK